MNKECVRRQTDTDRQRGGQTDRKTNRQVHINSQTDINMAPYKFMHVHVVMNNIRLLFDWEKIHSTGKAAFVGVLELSSLKGLSGLLLCLFCQPLKLIGVL